MKNQTQGLEHASIRQYCKTTRLPTVGTNFQSLAEQAKQNCPLSKLLRAAKISLTARLLTSQRA